MNKQSLLKKAFAASGLILATASVVSAQEYHNTTERIGGVWASGMPTVTIGSGADITVDGDWYLTANTVTIDPAAKISGAGTIHLMTPATYGATAAATALNAGGNLGSGTGIGCKLSIENGNTVVLGGSNDLVMSNNLNFAKVGAHLVIGARSVIFTSAAAAVSTAAPVAAVGFLNQPADAATTFQDAYIVTSGTGVVTKRALANGGVFTYTVGQSAASGASTDYTPATLTNTAAVRDISTQVKSYAGSAPAESNIAYGVDRTWQITGSAAGTATVGLTNNAGTEGTSYVRNAAFVTQQVGNGVWDVAAGGAPTMPNYTHSRSLNIPTSGLTAYYSKSNNSQISISGNAGLALIAGLSGDMQSNGIMRNDLQLYYTNGGPALLPTTDPYGLGATYANINNPTATLPTGLTPQIVDWARVDVYNSGNIVVATPVQSKAGLLLTDGRIIDVDGSILSFNSQAFTARAVVKHRNHLAVLSNPLAANGANIFKGNYPYDFTTSLSQASSIAGDPNQEILVGGKWCMWAGDVNQDLVTDITDRNIVNSRNLAGDFDMYQREDVNLDGVVDITDLNITNSANLQGIYSTLLNY